MSFLSAFANYKAVKSTDLLDVTYCDDLIICSDSEVWTYIVIEGENFGINTVTKLEKHAADIDTIFETVTDVPIHLRLTTMPFDAEEWYERMISYHANEVEAVGVSPAPAYEAFMRMQANTLRLHGAKSFRRYLGVYLGKRQNKRTRRWGETGPMAFISNKFDDVFGSTDAVPTDEELKRFRAKAQGVRARFISSSRLRAKGASAQDMWKFYYHCLNLGINQSAPKLYGKTWGALQASSMSAVVDTHDPDAIMITTRNRNIVQERRTWAAATATGAQNVPEPKPILKSHVVGMSVSLPKRGIPMMWVEQLKETGIPVDISFRFVVKSKQRAIDDAEKADRKITQESDFQAGVGRQSNDLIHIKQESAQHSYAVSNDQAPPQIKLTTRVFVHAGTKERAVEYSQEVINIMHEAMKTDLNPLFGTSYDYWKEAVPAQNASLDNSMTTHHMTYTDIGALTMSGVFTTVEVGHKYGYFIAFYGSTPVFFDPTLLGKQGKAPATFFNGSLGSGKTVAALQLIDLCRIRSYFTICIDPKGDLQALLSLTGRGHSKLWTLNTEGKPGMLDPFSLISREPNPEDPDRDTPEKAYEVWKGETVSLVDMAITTMLNTELTSTQRARLSELISLELNSLKDPKNPHEPSMHSLLERMKKGQLGKTATELFVEEGSAAHMAMRRDVLDLYSILEPQVTDAIGRLVFGKKTEEVKLRSQGVNTIIINTNGLDLPTDGAPPVTARERSSSMVYGLLATYVGNMMINDRSIPGYKLLVVDEFNVARDNLAFQSQIKRIVSMGRSLKITPLLLDQSTASADDERLFGNKLGGRWVGRSDEKSRKAVARALGYDPEEHPDEYRALVAEMPDKDRDRAGRALLSLPADDATGNTNNIKVIDFNIDWNPEYVAFLSNADGQSKDERASMQRYETNAEGIWIDPLSPPLEHATSVVKPVVPVSAPVPGHSPTAPVGDWV